METGEKTRFRLIGDYIIGQKIGSGSFSVVWKGRHRPTGLEVAIKEIDKKQLNGKMTESLLKEITILRNINHPNIVKLHESIETTDKIFLVLEYCMGGDLSGYLRHFGRISESIAKHFMIQLASGLQILRENNLIHRDLKPQNLLLSSKDETPLLKIGDFGFARYLTPQGLADTLCGSPLYMAPEIIQNKKYDAKADLWSVGAILYQMIAGKPPFDGNTQFQLFQNVLSSKELSFPREIIDVLHPDCIDLCRGLLRQNPVERLAFEEFFNHKFMERPRFSGSDDLSSKLQQNNAFARKDEDHEFAFNEKVLNEDVSITTNILPEKSHDPKTLTLSVGNAHSTIPDTGLSLRKSDSLEQSNSSHIGSMKTGSAANQGLTSSSRLRVCDSLEYIEKEYVIVNARFGSMETLTSSLEASFQVNYPDKFPNSHIQRSGKDMVCYTQTGHLALSSVCGVESLASHTFPSTTSQASVQLSDSQNSLSSHPTVRLQVLFGYIRTLSDLAKKKLNGGLHLESLSIELVTLALWKEAYRVCINWVTSASTSSTNEYPVDSLPHNLDQQVDFNKPAAVCSWLQDEFIIAFDRSEKLFKSIHDMDGSAEVPDAMGIIFQNALASGKSGAVDELMGNKSNALTLYARAITLFLFILEEATSLPLNPPFSLSDDDQQRIHQYIIHLKAHQSQAQILSSSNLSQNFPTK